MLLLPHLLVPPPQRGVKIPWLGIGAIVKLMFEDIMVLGRLQSLWNANEEAAILNTEGMSIGFITFDVHLWTVIISHSLPRLLLLWLSVLTTMS